MRPILSQYTPELFRKLSENEYQRYVPNSDVVGHVVAVNNGPILQFKLPDGLPEAPFVVSLTNILFFDLPHEKTVVYAEHANQPLISRRCYSFSIQIEGEEPTEYKYYPVSPKKKPDTLEDREIAYDTRPINRMNHTVTARIKFEEKPIKIKKNDWLCIKNDDISKRMEMPRKPDQNTVMGRDYFRKATEMAHRARQRLGLESESHNAEPIRSAGGKPRSAKEEVSDCLEDNREFFSNELNQLLQKMANAPFTSKDSIDPTYFHEDKQFRPEWLHRESHNLHPLDKDPQIASNLVAAQTRYNTAMMILERTVQYFALSVPESESKIKAPVEMLLDTEVANCIHYFAAIKIGNIIIRFEQHIDPFEKVSQDAKASDLASLVGILHCLIQNIPPLFKGSIKKATFTPSIYRSIGEKKPMDDSADAATLATTSSSRSLFR